MPEVPQTLSKIERLSGQAAVSALMSKGRWSHSTHFRFCVKDENGLDLNRIIVSVPKRNFKRAVKRNLLKRRIREAYRTQKSLVGRVGLDILFVYNSTEILSSEEIRTEIGEILASVGER